MYCFICVDQTVGYRMALAALNVAYEMTEYPWEGPRPTTTSVNINEDGTKTVLMTFEDGVFTYTPVENSGFYACALTDDIECDNTPGSWTLVKEIFTI